MINVTRTFLPPLEEYTQYVNRAFEAGWLTNRGQLVLELEEKLKKYLSVPNIIITNNGTTPLQIALRLLADGGEVITTPFSYVATTAVIEWDRCKPIFVDIDPVHMTIDEKKIEDKITERTRVILATHVFGNPCNIEAIQKLAKRYSLYVIYDAAHCFGVEYKGQSIFKYGDVSSCSFHATKLFHTGEGGAIFSNDESLNHKLYYSHNFGHDGPERFHGLGVNAKISELQAAMGLSVLPYMDKILNERKSISEYYRTELNSEALSFLEIRENTKWNYSYFPVLFENEATLLKVQVALKEEGINPRRYFYPSLNKLNYIKSERMPISENISSRILCLPLYLGLAEKDAARIVKIINRAI